MTKRFLQNRAAVFTSALILVVACIGIFAPIIAPNDPYETNIINKFAEYSLQYPLGTDRVLQVSDGSLTDFGRCRE